MNTTRLVSTLLAAAIVASPAVNAAENEAVLNPAEGKLILPHVVVGDEVYYAQLDRIGNTYTFDVNEASVVNITPQEGDDWATAEELVGDWSLQGSADHTLTFDADGTFTAAVPASAGCTAGAETGTWTIDSTTGVFTTSIVEDANGVCGLSHFNGMIRVEREVDDLVATLYSFDGGQQTQTPVTFDLVTAE